MSESIPSETDRQHDSAIKGADDEPAFDFEAHRHRAVEAYQALVPLYADFAQAVYSNLRTCLEKEEIKVHSVEHRAKSVQSFGDKAAEAAETNPNRPKYERPLSQITDMAGIRVTTYFPSTEEFVDPIITAEFDVIEKTRQVGGPKEGRAARVSQCPLPDAA